MATAQAQATHPASTGATAAEAEAYPARDDRPKVPTAYTVDDDVAGRVDRQQYVGHVRDVAAKHHE